MIFYENNLLLPIQGKYEMLKPKVFISYSWSSDVHKEHIKDIVQRLAADAVETVVDIYDLKEGDDKYHYMEKMVTDPTVTNVLLICDKKYSEKANARTAGVGDETQIISSEIYSKVSQSKFIPLIFEYDENDKPCTPAFLASRIYIDFSTPEKENANWERLIRVLYGQPEFVKPALGKPPAYLNVTTAQPTHHLHAKLSDLKAALLNNKPSIKLTRSSFFEVVFEYCDSLRTRSSFTSSDFAEKSIKTHSELLPARDVIVDWVLLESDYNHDSFEDSLLTTIEFLFELRSRPSELNSWNDDMFAAHKTFAYETFIYIIAALIKRENFKAINIICTSSYLLPSTERSRGAEFAHFTELYYFSDVFQSVLSSENRKLKSPVAELIIKSATRTDLNTQSLIQADLVCLMMSFIDVNSQYWYPQLMLYSQHGNEYPLFLRAAQKRNFVKIAEISGYSDPGVLRDKIISGIERVNANQWRDFSFSRSFEDKFNLKNWATLN